MFRYVYLVYPDKVTFKVNNASRFDSSMGRVQLKWISAEFGSQGLGGHYQHIII